MTDPNDRTTAPGLDLGNALRILRARKGIIAICALITTAVALALSLSQQKQYSAQSSLLFRDTNLDQTLFGSAYYSPPDPTQEAATNAELVSLPVVDARTAAAVGGGVTQGQVRSEVTIAQQGQSNVVTITATDPDPKRAAKIATIFAQQYVLFRRDADRAKVSDAVRLVQNEVKGLSPGQADSTQGRTLEARLQQLQVLTALQTGNAEVVQNATVPSSPSSPNPQRDGGLGLLLGVLLGVGLAFGFERLDRRFKDPAQIAATFDRPILGVIPESRAISAVSPDIAQLGPGEAEAFRMLRANLRYFNVDRDLRSILVTSSTPGDGKSTVSIHLAAAAAAVGDRVLLIEGDLRHPVFAARLKLSADRGLSQVLAGQFDSLRDVAYRIAVARGTKARGDVRSMDVVVAGPLPPNPSDLIESERLREILAQAEHEYDLVIVDTPPASVVSDAIPLVKNVSGVIVVCRIGRTTRDAAAHLNRQLDNLQANTLGVVVNAVGKKEARYGYAYDGYGGYGAGYGYDYASAGERSEEREALPEPSLVAGGSTNGRSTDVAVSNGIGREESTGTLATKSSPIVSPPRPRRTPPPTEPPRVESLDRGAPPARRGRSPRGRLGDQDIFDRRDR